MKAEEVYDESERRYPTPTRSPVDRAGEDLALQQQTAFEYGAAWAIKKLAADFPNDLILSVAPTRAQVQEWLTLQATRMKEIEP